MSTGPSSVPSSDEPGFDAVLVELVVVARRAGLRVSPAESIDAQRAAIAIGIHEREDLRAALAATMVKRDADRPVFDRVFDGFFRVDAGGRRGAADRLRAEGMNEDDLASLLERLQAALQGAGGSGSGGGLGALIEGGVELERRLEVALADAQVGRMQSPMQVGLFSLRVLERLGFEGMQRDLEALRAIVSEDPGLADGQRLADAIAAQLEALRRRVRARVRQDFERQNPERLLTSRAARLEREALAALDRDEVEQVLSEVRRLGLLLRDRMERRRRRDRRGRLDVRGTVRASLRTGGIPFRPVFRRRRRDKPKLVVLCDVSDSVRAAARFLLVLVYAMQEAFARTRSFVFVREVGEATALFDERPIEEAVALAFGGQAVSVGANSDYGRVFGQFAERHLDAIDRRTTVVILGDARSNDQDPNLEALEAIHRRAARVVWLNPEPEGSWGFGDSEMRSYHPWCSFVASVRSLGELRDAVERLATVATR